MTDPNPATFDIGDLFSGKAYPKETVTVFLDEETAYALRKNAKAAQKALAEEDQEAAERIQDEYDTLVKKGQANKVIVHLTGVSRDARRAVVDKVLEEYPLKYNFLGQPEPNMKADDVHANLRWALHIESIERPDGSRIVAPTPEQIKVFRGNAPDPGVEDIERAIQELSEGVKSGFEALVQDPDFLSQP